MIARWNLCIVLLANGMIKCCASSFRGGGLESRAVPLISFASQIPRQAKFANTHRDSRKSGGLENGKP
jgi:hypothetical protein